MEPSPSSSQQDQPNEDAIKDWSKEEKYHLWMALKTIGRHNIEKIQEYIITKNLKETKAAVDYFTALAYQHPIFQKDDDLKQTSSRKPLTPISEWANLLTKNFHYSELSTQTATAVRMIADLESIPDKEVTEGIDFRQVYHEIANAMEGKPFSPNIDEGTMAVLQSCITETSKAANDFIKNTTLRYVVDNIDLSENEINMSPRPTEDHELAAIRHLASQRSYNPLKIPEVYLKPEETSYDEKPGPSKNPRHTGKPF